MYVLGALGNIKRRKRRRELGKREMGERFEKNIASGVQRINKAF